MPSSPPEVEREIDHTRAQLALTLDAIERKLNARYLVEKGVDMFKDTFAGPDAVNRALGVVRNNPVPFALFGIGSAWLIAANTGIAGRVANDERVAAARRRVTDMASDLGSRAGDLASDVAGRVGIGGAGDQALGYTGNPMVDQAGRNRGEGWVHQVTGAAQGAFDSVRAAGNRAGDGASRVVGGMSDTVQRHPVVLGAIGVMAGALVAALLPLSRVEEDLIGDTRDELWHRAEDLGQQAVSRVRDAATRAATRAVDAAADAAAETVRQEIAKPSQQ